MSDSKPGVALVVGSSRGIGRQIAIDLAKTGYAGELYGHTQVRSNTKCLLVQWW